MKILLTGANGYIGKRLMPVLLDMGFHLICCVRDKSRFTAEEELSEQIDVIEVDFLDPTSLLNIPEDIDGAYYLIHSMASNSKNFDNLESTTAINFRDRLNKTKVKHVIYLGGIVNEKHLSKHLSSRKQVEEILKEGNYAFTALRAGIILGSGSASFEIMRDLVEKLPIMVTPKWLQTQNQPIAIRNVIQYLSKSLFNQFTYNNNYDIGGPDVLTYKQMLLSLAKIRRLKRIIITVPIMTPRLSSYWLYFVTSTSYKLAVNLVNSMKVPVICRPNNLVKKLNIELLSIDQAVELAFRRIQQNEVISSWIDSHASSGIDSSLSRYVQIPQYGCFIDVKKRKVKNIQETETRIWSIGGSKAGPATG